MRSSRSLVIHDLPTGFFFGDLAHETDFAFETWIAQSRSMSVAMTLTA